MVIPQRFFPTEEGGGVAERERDVHEEETAYKRTQQKGFRVENGVSHCPPC